MQWLQVQVQAQVQTGHVDGAGRHLCMFDGEVRHRLCLYETCIISGTAANNGNTWNEAPNDAGRGT